MLIHLYLLKAIGISFSSMPENFDLNSSEYKGLLEYTEYTFFWWLFFPFFENYLLNSFFFVLLRAYK